MKPTILLAVMAAVGLAACDSATAPHPVSLEPHQFALVQSHNNTPPAFKIDQKSSGEAIIIGWCDEAAGIVLTAAPGTGTATHMGRFTVQQAQCISTVTGAITNGEATLTAANGDQIFMTYTGAIVGGNPQLPVADLTYVVVGGTGRFANAEGEIDIHVEYTTPSIWISTGSGWLRYSASDRSGK